MVGGMLHGEATTARSSTSRTCQRSWLRTQSSGTGPVAQAPGGCGGSRSGHPTPMVWTPCSPNPRAGPSGVTSPAATRAAARARSASPRPQCARRRRASPRPGPPAGRAHQPAKQSRCAAYSPPACRRLWDPEGLQPGAVAAAQLGERERPSQRALNRCVWCSSAAPRVSARRGEHAARGAHRAELAVIADQYQLGAGPTGELDEAIELAGVDHACLVDDHDLAGSDPPRGGACRGRCQSKNLANVSAGTPASLRNTSAATAVCASPITGCPAASRLALRRAAAWSCPTPPGRSAPRSLDPDP